MFKETEYRMLIDLDKGIEEYKNEVLEPMFKDYCKGNIHYNQYYKGKENKIYWTMMREFQKILESYNQYK